MSTRTTHDTMGEMQVPEDKLWSAQTQRSKENFTIGGQRMPMQLVYAITHVKRACALVNRKEEFLSQEKAEAIVKAAEEVLAGQHDEHFPLVVWQTGSGTQTNMNVNEVLANRANQLLGKPLDSGFVHPNDDVNKGQSSNDVFPTAMHVATVLAAEDALIPAAEQMQKTLNTIREQYTDVVKIGRTHLQDATPITLGQEISAWETMLSENIRMIQESLEHVRLLAIGGTAVGTGLNTTKDFGERVTEEICTSTGKQFISAENTFHQLTSYDALTHFHGALKSLAANLMKIANDVRWLASGPRCGIGEVSIPANEPGSSIMPGKVNPTQAEALTMVAVQVMGNDVTVGMAASQGNFQLNVFKPVIIYNVLQSMRLLSDSMHSFTDKCLIGMTPNTEKISEYLNNSLMLVTALNPHIGYDNSATVAKYAFEHQCTLKEAVLALELLSEEGFDAVMQPQDMV